MAEPSGRVTASIIFTESEPESYSLGKTFFLAIDQRRDINPSLPLFLGLNIKG